MSDELTNLPSLQFSDSGQEGLGDPIPKEKKPLHLGSSDAPESFGSLSPELASRIGSSVQEEYEIDSEGEGMSLLGNFKQDDYGRYKQDMNLTTDEFMNLNETRGLKQSAGDKLGNGAIKVVGKIGTVTAGGIGMLLYGVPAMIFSGEANAMWNNDLSHSLHGIDDWMDGRFPNHYTEAERNMTLGGKVGTMNFWANEVGNGVSFLAGAALTEGLIGAATLGTGNAAATAGLAAWATRGLKAAGALAPTVDRASTIGKLYRASRVFGKTANIAEKGKVMRQIVTGAGYEASVESAHSYETILENKLEALAGDRIRYIEETEERSMTREEKLSLLSPEEQTSMIDDALTTSNMLFLGTLALVGYSNILMLPMKYGAGITGKALPRASLMEKMAQKAGMSTKAMDNVRIGSGLAWKGFYEGVIEEGGQGTMQRAASDYALLSATRESGNMFDVIENTLKSIKHANTETWNTTEGMTEMAIGAGMGLIGLPIPGTMSNATFTDTRNDVNRRRRILDLVEKLEKEKPGLMENFKNNVQFFKSVAERADAKNAALEERDIVTAKSLEFDDFFDWVSLKIATGQYDDVAREADEVAKMGIEDFREMGGYSAEATEAELKARQAYVVQDIKRGAEKVKEAYKRVDRDHPMTAEEKINGIGKLGGKGMHRRNLANVLARSEKLDERTAALTARIAELMGGELVFTDSDWKSYLHAFGAADRGTTLLSEEAPRIKFTDKDGNERTVEIPVGEESNPTIGGAMTEIAKRLAVLDQKKVRTEAEEAEKIELEATAKDLSLNVDPRFGPNTPMRAAFTEIKDLIEPWQKKDPIGAALNGPEVIELLEDLRELNFLRAKAVDHYNDLINPKTAEEFYKKKEAEMNALISKLNPEAKKKKDEEDSRKIAEFKAKIEAVRTDTSDRIKSIENKINEWTEFAEPIWQELIELSRGVTTDKNGRVKKDGKFIKNSEAVAIEKAIKDLNELIDEVDQELKELNAELVHLRETLLVLEEFERNPPADLDRFQEEMQVTMNDLSEMLGYDPRQVVEDGEQILPKEEGIIGYLRAQKDLLEKHVDQLAKSIVDVKGKLDDLKAYGRHLKNLYTEIKQSIVEWSPENWKWLNTEVSMTENQIKNLKSTLSAIERLHEKQLSKKIATIEMFENFHRMSVFRQIMDKYASEKDILEQSEKGKSRNDPPNFEAAELSREDGEGKILRLPEMSTGLFSTTGRHNWGWAGKEGALQTYAALSRINPEDLDDKQKKELALATSQLRWYNHMHHLDPSGDNNYHLVMIHKDNVPKELDRDFFTRDKDGEIISHMFYEGEEEVDVKAVLYLVSTKEYGTSNGKRTAKTVSVNKFVRLDDKGEVNKKGKHLVFTSMREPTIDMDDNDGTVRSRYINTDTERSEEELLNEYKTFRDAIISDKHVQHSFHVYGKSQGTIVLEQTPQQNEGRIVSVGGSNHYKDTPIFIPEPPKSEKAVDENEKQNKGLKGKKRVAVKPAVNMPSALGLPGLAWVYDHIRQVIIPMYGRTLNSGEVSNAMNMMYKLLMVREEALNMLPEGKGKGATAWRDHALKYSVEIEYVKNGVPSKKSVNLMSALETLIHMSKEEVGEQYNIHYGEDPISGEYGFVFGENQVTVTLKDFQEGGDKFQALEIFLSSKYHNVDRKTVHAATTQSSTQGKGKSTRKRLFPKWKMTKDSEFGEVVLDSTGELTPASKVWNNYNEYLLTDREGGVESPLLTRATPIDNGGALDAPRFLGGYLMFRKEKKWTLQKLREDESSLRESGSSRTEEPGWKKEPQYDPDYAEDAEFTEISVGQLETPPDGPTETDEERATRAYVENAVKLTDNAAEKPSKSEEAPSGSLDQYLDYFDSSHELLSMVQSTELPKSVMELIIRHATLVERISEKGEESVFDIVNGRAKSMSEDARRLQELHAEFMDVQERTLTDLFPDSFTTDQMVQGYGVLPFMGSLEEQLDSRYRSETLEEEKARAALMTDYRLEMMGLDLLGNVNTKDSARLKGFGRIMLNAMAPGGALYHESFHNVIWYLFTPEQAKELYNKVRALNGTTTTFKGETKKLSDLSDKEADEWLAEEFRRSTLYIGAYKLGQDTIKNEAPKNFIRRIFDAIRTFFQGLFKINSKLDLQSEIESEILSVFADIQGGKYLGMEALTTDKSVGELSMVATQLVKDTSATFTRDLMSSLTAYMIDAIGKPRAVPGHGIVTPEFTDLLGLSTDDDIMNESVSAMYAHAFEKMREDLHNVLSDPGLSSADRSSLLRKAEAVFPEFTKARRWDAKTIAGYEARKEVLKIHAGYLKHLGFTIEVDEEREESGVGTRNFSDEATDIETSPTNSADRQIKILFGTLVSEETNSLGLKGVLSLEETLKPIQFHLAGLLSYERQRAEMRRLQDIYPWLSQVFDRLGDYNESNMDELTFEQISLIVMFEGQMAKTAMDPRMTFFEDNGRIYSLNPNHQRIFKSIRREWMSNVRIMAPQEKFGHVRINSMGHIVFDPNGKIDLGSKKTTIMELKEDIEKMNLPSLISAAKLIGIEFSDQLKIMKANENMHAIDGDSLTEVMRKALRFVLDDIAKGQSPFVSLFDREFSDSVTRLNRIAEMEYLFGSRKPEPQYQNPSGKISYGITLNNYYSTIANMTWKELSRYLDRTDTGEGFVENNQYAVNSRLSRYMYERFLETDENAGDRGNAISIVNIAGASISGPGKIGASSSKLGYPDMILTHAQALLDNVFPSLRAADISTEFGIEMQILSDYNTISDVTNPEDNVMDDYLEDEIAAAVIGVHDGKFLKGFDKRTSELRIMKAFLSPGQNKEVNELIKKLSKDKSIVSALRKGDRSPIEEWISKNSEALKKSYIVRFAKDNNSMDQYMIKAGLVSAAGQENRVLTGVSGSWFGKDDSGAYYTTVSEKEYQAFLTKLTVKHFVGKTESFKIFLNDPALYSDLYKRVKGAVGTKNNFSVNPILNQWFATTEGSEKTRTDGFMDMAVITEPKAKAIIHESLKKGMSPDLLELYLNSNIDKGDGTIMITLDTYRQFAIRGKEWSPEQEKMYWAIKDFEKNGTPIPQDLTGMFPPKKYQSFGPQSWGDGGLNPTAFLKMSVVAIYPSMGQVNGKSYPGIQQIHDYLEKSKLGGFILPSAFKVGAPSPGSPSVVSVGNDENGGMVFSKFNERQRITFDLRFWGTQLKVNAKLKGTAPIGTQARVQILSDLYDNGVLTLPELKDAIEIYHEAQNGLTRRGFSQMLKEFNLSKNSSGDYVLGKNDYSKIIDLMVEEGAKRDVSSAILDGLITLKESNKEGKSLPLDMLVEKKRMESLLWSLANSKVIRQRFSGDMYVQQSNIGFEVVHQTETNSPVADPLKFYKMDNGNYLMEVYIAPHWKDMFGDDLVITEDGIFNKTVSEETKVGGPELLKMIGIRIPTDGIHSIEMIKVKGFLHSSAGPTVIVPSELVMKAGSDFDIDKLVMYFPSHEVYWENGVKKLRREEFVTDVREWFNGKRKKEENHVAAIELALAMAGERNFREVINQEEELTEEETPLFIKSVLKEHYGAKNNKIAIERFNETRKFLREEGDDYNEFISMNPNVDIYKLNTAGAIQNRIMDQIFAMLTQKDRLDSFLSPVGAPRLQAMAQQLDLMERTDFVNLGGTQVLDSKGELIDKSFEYHEDTTFERNLQAADAFWKSLQVVGIAALHSTHTVKSQIADLRLSLKNTYTTKGGAAMTRPIGLRFEGFDNTKDDLSFSGQWDIRGKTNGVRITEMNSEVVNAAVDGVNNPFLHILNLGPDMAPTWEFLIRGGVPGDTIKNLMNQPVVKEYLNMMAVTSSRVSQANERRESRDDIINSIRIKWKPADYKFVDKHFSEKELEDMIGYTIDDVNAMPASRADLFKSYQYQLLDDVMMYMELAQELSSLVAAQSFDTKAPKSRNHLRVILQAYEDVMAKGIFVNAERITEGETFLKAMTDYNKEMTNVMKNLFLTESAGAAYQDDFKKIINVFGGSNVFMDSEEKAKILDRYENGFISFILQRIASSDNNTLGYEADRLLFGENSMAVQLAEIKTGKHGLRMDVKYDEVKMELSASAKKNIESGKQISMIRMSLKGGGNLRVGETAEMKVGDKSFLVSNRGSMTIQEAGGKAKMEAELNVRSSSLKVKDIKDWFNGSGKMYVYDVAPNTISKQTNLLPSTVSELRNNPLIESLIPEISPVRSGPLKKNDYIELSSRTMNTFESDVLYDAYFEIVDFDANNGTTIAKDLMKTALLQSGLDQRPESFIQALPGSALIEFAGPIIERYSENKSEFMKKHVPAYYQKFFEQNMHDTRIVPLERGANKYYAKRYPYTQEETKESKDARREARNAGKTLPEMKTSLYHNMIFSNGLVVSPSDLTNSSISQTEIAVDKSSRTYDNYRNTAQNEARITSSENQDVC